MNTRTIEELVADYDELNDFRNSVGNEEVLNGMVDVALKLNRQIVEYPISTIEELHTKVWHLLRHVAHLGQKDEPPKNLEDLGYWMLHRDIRTLIGQQQQKEAA